MGKHTPGPWKLHPEYPNQVFDSHADAPTVRYNLNNLICDCATLGNPDKSGAQVANARLIAAAPDLLEACRAAKNCAHFGYPGEPRPADGRVYITADALNAICAAIAKATA